MRIVGRLLSAHTQTVGFGGFYQTLVMGRNLLARQICTGLLAMLAVSVGVTAATASTASAPIIKNQPSVQVRTATGAAFEYASRSYLAGSVLPVRAIA